MNRPPLSSLAALPGLAKASLRSSEERASDDDRVGKRELEVLLRAAGYGGPGQGRETARVLKCDEKTLRRWRDPECRKDLAPAEIRIILQGFAALRLRSA